MADLTLDPPSAAAATAPAPAGASVQLRGVTRRYANGTVALADLDLTIDPGESVAVVGRSGSGKSTLLNILGLLDVPDSGDVLIDGHRVAGTGDRARSARRSSDLGFVFQRAHLVPTLSVRENVLLGLRYSPLPDALADAAAREALREVELEARIEAEARTLSGGEMQRVAIARTLARPARLWLADEPTGNLDSNQSVEIIELLKQRAAERGASLVVVTHEPDIAARLDRVITLSDGRIVADTGRRGRATPAADEHPAPGTARPARVPRRKRLTRTLRFIGQGIAANPGRTRSGIAAATVAVALTVAALGLAQSASAQVTSLFDAQRATQVTARLSTDSPEAPRWPIRVEEVAGFPGVTGVEYWQHRTGVPMANGSVAATDVDLVEVGATPGAATDSTVSWAPGGDHVLDDGEVILGAVLAERLAVTQLDLSPEVVVGGDRLRVVGLLRGSRSGTATGAAFVTGASTDGLTASLSGELFVETLPGAARTVADRLPALADPYQTMRMAVDPVLEADAYRGELQESVSASLLVLAVVASLAGLVGVVFVNILSVGSRTAEFGVRRAFGASRRELVSLVVGECAALGLVGATIGLAVGFVAVMAVTAAARWQPVFDLRLLLVPLIGALVFGTLGGVPPAIAAGRVQPADAVRS
ncbi:ABC transporter ATP-binding protein/permease [Cellulomonas hominis]|uniref:ABC transporter ATP-binding protein/permease n=1 Tax=Cellulomonas hominis TaxID=156981 RepID=UPI001C0FCF24|nr:ATP-binding cassette domain-containing protein [Cellulomonas hominis]MBU5422550.1 ABC transporter ATP-binding protein/permease [Cellulomonas hominis]